MTITTSGTTITFNDSTTQTTAPVNTNANVTSVNGVTGAVVDTASGAIGSYVVGCRTSSPTTGWTFGTTYASSLIGYQAASGVFSTQYSDRTTTSYSLSGTWRAMANGVAGSVINCCGLIAFESCIFVRVS